MHDLFNLSFVSFRAAVLGSRLMDSDTAALHLSKMGEIGQLVLRAAFSPTALILDTFHLISVN